MVDLSVNGADISWELDTGAPCSLISQREVEDHGLQDLEAVLSHDIKNVRGRNFHMR